MIQVYDEVVKVVMPKRQLLFEQRVVLERERAALHRVEEQLAQAVLKVEHLEAECEAALAEKARLAETAQLTVERLTRADKLASGLASEKVRHKQHVRNG